MFGLLFPFFTMAQSDGNYGKKFPGWYMSTAAKKQMDLLYAVGDMDNNKIPLKFTLDTDENFESIKKSGLQAFFYK